VAIKGGLMAKKAKNESVNKTIANEAVVYDVPALVVTPNVSTAITGNYGVIEKALQQWRDRVSKMKLSENNLEEVSKIKKAAVAVRNNLDRVATATKKALFNDPKAIFEARMKGLYSLIADVEGSADNVLGKLEQQRIDEINEVLNHYKDELQKQYKLDNLELIEYKKEYYNKTVPKGYSSMDKYWKDSLKERFEALKKAQDVHNANVRLVTETCKDEPRLNVGHWLDRLSSWDVAAVIENIKIEKKRLQELDNPSVETEVVEAEVVETKKVVLGIPPTINFKSDFPGRLLVKKVEITYPCDLGDALTELFKSLRVYGIKVKVEKKKDDFIF
jgi:hypothetical protein